MSISHPTELTHEHITVAEARANFTDITNRVAYGHERLVVDRYHKPLVAMVSIDDLRLLEMLEDEQDLQRAVYRLKTMKKHGTTSLDELEKELKET